MNPPLLPIEHRFRASALVGEILLRLDGDTLLQISEGLPPFVIPLASTTRVRLQYAPTRFQTGRFVCRLDVAGKGSVAFQNEHFAGFMSFEDRSETYRDLVLAILRRRSALGQPCRYHAGTSLANWLAQSAFLVGSLSLLATVFWHLGPSTSGLVAVKLSFIAAMLPFACLWVSRNRPRSFDPALVPDGLLPPASRESERASV